MFEAIYNDQWRLEADEDDYRIDHVDGSFYGLIKGPYGNPIIIAEPSKAFPLPPQLKYIDSQSVPVSLDDPEKPVERIAGVICKDIRSVVHRFSLSSPAAENATFRENGAEVEIDGKVWYLVGLFRKDANRIINYDAFYGEQPVDTVVIKELADVVF